jgi:hypothetical protein
VPNSPLPYTGARGNGAELRALFPLAPCRGRGSWAPARGSFDGCLNRRSGWQKSRRPAG